MGRQDPIRGADAGGRLAVRLGDRLRADLGVSALRLWRSTDRGDALLYAKGEAPVRSAVSLEIDHGEVVRIEFSEPGPATLEAIDRLAPWICLVLEAHDGSGDLDGDPRRVGGPVAASGSDVVRARVAGAAAAWKLSPTQAAVLDLLVQGLDKSDIAAALGIVEEAVAIHVGRILRVSGAATPTDVVLRLRSRAGEAVTPRGLVAARAAPANNRDESD